MKLFIALTLLLNTLLIAQVDKLERLKQLQQEGKLSYQYLGADIYKLTYPDGETKELYFGKPKTQPLLDSIPTTTIDTWNVDTMLYHNMYSYWKEFPTMTGSGYQLIIGDANKNGLPEIYAPTKDFNDPPDFQNMEIFEIDTNGVYASKYTYADSIAVLWGLYDIKRDGNLELLTRQLRYTNEYIFFKLDSTTGYPTKLDFVFDDYPSQKDDPTFGDFDKNGKTDMVFYYDAASVAKVICEYDSVTNNFNTIVEFTDTIGYYQGFAVGDFDEDKSTDIVYGSVYGDVFIIENTSEHSYKRTLVANTGGTNSFMTFATRDINENGKSEFWISSTTYVGLTEVLRFSCYESIRDNEYQEISRIDFLNVFPFYASNSFAKDVDNDGKEEIVICFDEHVFIIKADPKGSYPFYKTLYMTRNSTPGGYWGASMYDLDNDGFDELLIHRDKTRTDGKFKFCTDVFYPDFLTSINEGNHFTNLDYSLQQNYPNPFNPNTSIKYTIPNVGTRLALSVRLVIYDILGNEIITLVNEEKQQGNYTVQWNGKDKFNNTVSSGIYFINLKTLDYNKTIKGVMLK